MKSMAYLEKAVLEGLDPYVFVDISLTNEVKQFVKGSLPDAVNLGIYKSQDQSGLYFLVSKRKEVYAEILRAIKNSSKIERLMMGVVD